MIKVAVVAVAGVSAFLHTIARSKAGLAVFGALSALGALGALFIGIQLH
jgi:hypothetical protein